MIWKSNTEYKGDVLRYNDRDFAYDAFGGEFTALWGGTKFSAEIPNLCHFRAYTAFWNSEDQDIIARRKLLYTYLSRVFAIKDPQDTLNKWFSILPSNAQLLKRTVKNLCVTYNKAPRRTFARGQEYASPDDTAIINRWYNEAGIDSLMQSAYRRAKLMNVVLIHVAQADGEPRLTAYSPDQFRVAVNDRDRTKIDEVWIPAVFDDKLCYRVWTRTEYKRLDASTLEALESIPNEYAGELPFVPLCLSNDKTDFYGGGLFELVEEQLRVNKLTLMVDESSYYSGFGVWLLTNIGASEKDFRLNPGIAVTRDGVKMMEGSDAPPTIEHITSTSNVADLDQLRKDRIREAQEEQGLPNSVVNRDGSTLTGVAMLVDQKELIEMRDEDINTLRRVEQKILDTLIMVMNADAQAGLVPQVSVSIDFAEQRFYFEPTAEFAFYTQKWQAGLMATKDYVQAITGDDTITTDEAAVAYINANKAVLAKLTQSAADSNTQQLQDSNASTS